MNWKEEFRFFTFSDKKVNNHLLFFKKITYIFFLFDFFKKFMIWVLRGYTYWAAYILEAENKCTVTDHAFYIRIEHL